MNDPKQKRITLIMVGAALMIVTAGIIYLSLTTDANPTAALNDGYDPYRAPLADAKAAFDNGEALFVDVRSVGEYTASHITGAISIPLEGIAGNEPPVDKGALIYTYCT